ncbi:MAG: YfhO family protein [Faecalibacterium sp.]
MAALHAVRQPRLLGHKQNKFWLTVGLCALTAALIFLPFCLVDGGFFHYAGDFNSQQISFYRYMNGFIKGRSYPDSLASSVHDTFSWATDLGSGTMNAYSFYLYGSPFFWLSLLFPQNWLPYLMVPLLVLKFAAAGGGAYLYLRRYVRDQNYAVLGACLYAFSGFSLYNVFFNHFVDVVALFPWMLWALDECIYEDRRGLFAFWVAVNLLNNYFFFVGQVLFLVIYFVCKVSAGDFRLSVRLFGTLAWESVLGVALGCLLLWPAVLSLLQNPRTIDFSSGWGFLTYSRVQQYLAILLSWVMPPDSPYITSIWSEGVIKWTSMSAYLPLCSLAGVMAYWRSRTADSKKRIVAVCAVFALVPILNSAFYALNSSYYARWYYMPVLILCAMTVSALEDLDIDLEAPAKGILWIMIATLAFALVPVLNSDTGEWSLGVLSNPGQYAVVLAFGLGGLCVFCLICGRWRRAKCLPQRLLAAVLAFSCLFGVVHIGIGKFGQWYSDAGLVDQYTRAVSLKEELPEGDYRIDTYQTYDNLGLWLDKSCLQYFGSTAAPSILSFYPSVGIKRDVRSEPSVSDYALRGLLSVEYTITEAGSGDSFEEQADEGWVYWDTRSGFAIYRNTNYVPMGFTYEYYVTEKTYEAVPKTLRSNLLMRALLLTEEQIEAYGRTLTQLPEEQLNDLYYQTYVQDCKDRRASACDSFTMTNSGFSAHIVLDSEELVFFSVPHDDGFTAFVNGQQTEILRVDNGLMAVLCPAGESSIEFVYEPDGIRLSRTVTLAAIPVFLVYTGYFVWKKRRKARR